MSTLLVGFDSAWTAHNRGAVVGSIRDNNGKIRALGKPAAASFGEAQDLILEWQRNHAPSRTVILIDQPTIVTNASGQRPVENIVSSPVSLRFGGMQPANTTRAGMFDATAPVWSFIKRFGGPAQFDALGADVQVIETYPILEIIARGWTLPDARRTTGRLPKYNPQRTKTFSPNDWVHLCGRVAESFARADVQCLVNWCKQAGHLKSPRKVDQDGLDACICLLIAMGFADGRECLAVGDQETAYIVVSDSSVLRQELETRCRRIGRNCRGWVHQLRRQLPDG